MSLPGQLAELVPTHPVPVVPLSIPLALRRERARAHLGVTLVDRPARLFELAVLVELARPGVVVQRPREPEMSDRRGALEEVLLPRRQRGRLLDDRLRRTALERAVVSGAAHLARDHEKCGREAHLVQDRGGVAELVDAAVVERQRDGGPPSLRPSRDLRLADAAGSGAEERSREQGETRAPDHAPGVACGFWPARNRSKRTTTSFRYAASPPSISVVIQPS